MSESRPIILATINARYMHSAFGLRYLYANMGDLQAHTEICEFTLQEWPTHIAEMLLHRDPLIIGLSVYIWNVSEITQLVLLLKQIAPHVVIVLGGPEVSHYPDVPEVTHHADYIIAGAGEISFRQLCHQILQHCPPTDKFIQGESPALDQLVMPYAYYSDEDIKNRLIYVEASRGCPYTCEFCLSALDRTAKAFPLPTFLAEMDILLQRGVRNFKFIDRTFNLKIKNSIEILEFFLDRMVPDLYLHFEVVPDHLPDKLKQVIQRFPPNSLQFEIGVQTFDPHIQSLISRKQNNHKTKANIQWLRMHTGAHLHTDLIFGLPGDTLDTFSHSFDQLVALNPHEIQVGILKRLRGAPLNRHSKPYQLRFNPGAPYAVVSTRDIDFFTLQRMTRFARYWDMIANSGRFAHTLPLILGTQPFARFLQLSDTLYRTAHATWKIALPRLFELLYPILISELKIDAARVKEALDHDFQRAGLKGTPRYARPASVNTIKSHSGKANKRQAWHVQ